MAVNLIQSLQEIRDFRAFLGKRYPHGSDFVISDNGYFKWTSEDILHLKISGCDIIKP